VPDPASWNLSGSANDSGGDSLQIVQPVSLPELLQALVQAAFHVSDDISATYFTHSGETKRSLGT